MRSLKGIGVSPGIVIGRAVILIHRSQVLRYQIPASRVEHEWQRLQTSRERSREQLEAIRARMEKRRPELAALFDAQLLMLDDPMLVTRVGDIVREQQVNAEWALQQVLHEFNQLFEEVSDAYLRERNGDVADLVGRLRTNLRREAATPRELLRELDELSVLIADELTPSLGRAGRLEPRPWIRHRRRQPHLPHCHPRAVARRAGDCRPPRCEPAHPGRADGDHRWLRQRVDHRSDS
jgi:phosphotransferase system enzyme I (PtsI)